MASPAHTSERYTNRGDSYNMSRDIFHDMRKQQVTVDICGKTINDTTTRYTISNLTYYLLQLFIEDIVVIINKITKDDRYRLHVTGVTDTDIRLVL